MVKPDIIMVGKYKFYRIKSLRGFAKAESPYLISKKNGQDWKIEGWASRPMLLSDFDEIKVGKKNKNLFYHYDADNSITYCVADWKEEK